MTVSGIVWEGPCRMDGVVQNRTTNGDYGLNQIYEFYRIFRLDTLLYIVEYRRESARGSLSPQAGRGS
jgi:hypothetical protein